MYILDVMNNVTSDFIKPLNWHFKHFTYSRCHFSSDLYIPFVQFDTEGAHFMIMADVTTAEEMQDQIKTLSAELSQSMKVCVWKAGLATFVMKVLSMLPVITVVVLH